MTEFKFKKKFGQNFLKNEHIIEKIISSISPTEKDLIIEIGPGAGAITAKLKRYNANLIAFEIDVDTAKYLKPLEDEKTQIIYEDFLEVNLEEKLSSIKYENLYFLGNLPYYITTPIIEKVIDSTLDFKSFTIMVQKEVADRFLAKPHNREYGYMTVLLNYWFNIERLTNVSRSDFIPAPKVKSTVLLLKTKATPNVNYQKFKQLIKDAFQFKRKTINNNLKKYDKTVIEKVLIKNGYSMQSRAEEIDLDTFIELANSI